MLRWSGLLAAVLTAALLLVLWKRTEVVQLAGTVDSGPGFVNEAVLEEYNPGRGIIFVTTQGPERDGELKRYSAAGIASTMFGGKSSNSRKWMTFLPKEVAASLEEDDEIIISVRWLSIDEGMKSPYRMVCYQFRRGATTWSAGEADNWMFLLAYGLTGGPLMAWAVVAGVIQLFRFSAKPRNRD